MSRIQMTSTVVNLELQWKILEYSGYQGIQETNFPLVTMSDYIVFFDIKKEYGLYGLEVYILEPEKALFYEVGYIPGLSFDKCVACSWKENQIIILGCKNYAFLHSEISLGVMMILKSSKGFTARYLQPAFLQLPCINLDTCTMHILQDTLAIIYEEDHERYYEDSKRRIYYLDLETFRSPKSKLFDLTRHVSYSTDEEIFVHFVRRHGIEKQNFCMIFDDRGWKRNIRMNENYLYQKDFQFQVKNHQMYGFLHYSWKTDYEMLYFYNKKKEIWERCLIQGISKLSSSQQKRMVLFRNHVYLFDGSPKIFCCDLSPLESIQSLSSLKKESKEYLPSNLLKLFLEEAPYYDVTFQVESELVHAHKWCLSIQSQYFSNMFSSGMIEEKSSKITIPDMKASTFKALLEYLYTSQVELNEPLALELLQQADKYLVGSLKIICEQYLANCISADNYVVIANLADLLDLNSLKEVAVNFMLRNLKEIKERQDFSQVSNILLKEIINKLSS